MSSSKKKRTKQPSTKIEIQKNGQVFFWKKSTQQEYLNINNSEINELSIQVKDIIKRFKVFP